MIIPPRFRTREDAMLFMECLENKRPFPQEKMIPPFIEVDGKGTWNLEYQSAPFEEIFINE